MKAPVHTSVAARRGKLSAGILNNGSAVPTAKTDPHRIV